jgi:hypothetical protein
MTMAARLVLAARSSVQEPATISKSVQSDALIVELGDNPEPAT